MAYGVYKDRKSGVYQQDTTGSYETLTARIKCSLKTENKRTAEDRARQNYDATVEELRCKFHGIAPKAALTEVPKLRCFYEDEYLPWASNEYIHRQRTLRGIKEHVQIVLADDVLSRMSLDAIDEDVVDKFKARLIRLNYSGCTINHAMSALRRLLRVANRWSGKKGYKIHVPDFSGMRMKERVHDRVVTAEDEALYAEKCSRRHLVFFKLLINTGMEPGYAAALRWEDVHFENEKIPYVHDRCKKTDTRERDIPMTPELHGLLLEWWMEHGRPPEGWAFVSPKDPKVHCPLWSFHSAHKRIFGKSLPKKAR
jgi:integrase